MLFVGGESQRVIFSVFSGYSSQAQPAYLEPNSQSMQKNRRGVGSLLAVFSTNSMLKTRTYLEPNSSSLQKPIGGRSTQLLSKLYKGTITVDQKF